MSTPFNASCDYLPSLRAIWEILAQAAEIVQTHMYRASPGLMSKVYFIYLKNYTQKIYTVLNSPV